jgi:hypothetical protein
MSSSEWHRLCRGAGNDADVDFEAGARRMADEVNRGGGDEPVCELVDLPIFRIQ